ncbi:MAG: carboxymuconolactone decarboxylase family protein [Solirubrobacteraceae bacterium]|nr:carboxymuconolactone decarboxylase family protein [Solirubrobacteraceae bacterium]
MSRIAPLDPPYAPSIAEMLAKWMPPGADVEPLKLFRTMAVHEELTARMRPLGAGILGSDRVPARLRELVIHRTCARCGAEYEWGVHAAAFGRPLGFTDEQLRATVEGGSGVDCWSEDEVLVLRLADELHDTGRLTDSTFEGLRTHFTDAQILEFAICAGWYHVISFVIGTAEVEPEPWAEPYPGGHAPSDGQLAAG